MMYGVAESVFLIALGTGYLVYYFANREEKATKSLGRIIGIFMMILSAMLMINSLILGTRMGCYGMKGMRGMMGQKMMQGSVSVGPQAPQK